MIIPCYNGEETVGRCVRSIIADRHENVEILVIDDGSKDRTKTVVKELAREFAPRVRLYSQEQKGANSARNLGLKNALGKYVQFLDCDDYMINDKMFKSVSAFESNSNLLCVYSDGEVHVEGRQGSIGGAVHKNVRAIADGHFKEFAFALNTNLPIWKVSHLLTNGLFWDEELPCWQESEFYFRVLLSLGSSRYIAHLPESMIVRRRNKQGISSKNVTPEYIRGQNLALDKIYTICQSSGHDNLSVKNQWVEFKWRLLKRSLVHDSRESWELVAPSISNESTIGFQKFVSRIPYPVARLAYKLVKILGAK